MNSKCCGLTLDPRPEFCNCLRGESESGFKRGPRNKHDYLQAQTNVRGLVLQTQWLTGFRRPPTGLGPPGLPEVSLHYAAPKHWACDALASSAVRHRPYVITANAPAPGGDAVNYVSHYRASSPAGTMHVRSAPLRQGTHTVPHALREEASPEQFEASTDMSNDW
jgi:hypothetical protein